MRTFIIKIILAGACSPGLIAVCGGAAATDPVSPLAAVTKVCRVDPTQVIRTIPPGLFGTNLEWFNNANGIARADGSVDPAWARLLRGQGVDNIRFPGGTLSDFYHWRDGIGPVSRRPARDHPTDEGRSANVMGTPEFLRFAAATGARPLITVAPSVYADRFLAFAASMRRADTSIKLIAIGTANATTATLPYPDWSEVVLAKAAGEMDYLAVHNAYFPMIFGLSGPTTKAVYQSLWAAPEAVDRSLARLDRLIARYEKNRRIEIAVTEWGALFSFDQA